MRKRMSETENRRDTQTTASHLLYRNEAKAIRTAVMASPFHLCPSCGHAWASFVSWMRKCLLAPGAMHVCACLCLCVCGQGDPFPCLQQVGVWLCCVRYRTCYFHRNCGDSQLHVIQALVMELNGDVCACLYECMCERDKWPNEKLSTPCRPILMHAGVKWWCRGSRWDLFNDQSRSFALLHMYTQAFYKEHRAYLKDPFSYDPKL